MNPLSSFAAALLRSSEYLLCTTYNLCLPCRSLTITNGSPSGVQSAAVTPKKAGFLGKVRALRAPHAGKVACRSIIPATRTKKPGRPGENGEKFTGR